MAGFEGAGYVTGYGTNADANTRFVVSVLDDGMYGGTIRYASGYGAIFSIEAEDAVVAGTPAGGELPLIRDDAFAKYASNGKYVNGMTSYDGAERYLEIDDIVVPEDGIYKLVVRYANGESAGTHAYNNDVVERYATRKLASMAARRRPYSSKTQYPGSNLLLKR
ncbi:hypothetical protein [Paenibacillus cellulositrophicus]|uniref:hypothetical protein n=1 Tax=Paenibacillus cellulositrophicus TaxID=562959 RepID=UPI003D9680F3